MIVLDIETSGLTGREGIWQIAAIDLNNPENIFLEEARIDDNDGIMEDALKIVGKTEVEIRDSSKQSQAQMIENYLDWVSKVSDKIIMGANISWDNSIIQDKCFKYGLNKKFRMFHGFRGIDLLTIAQMKFFGLNGNFLMNQNGQNKMSLDAAMAFCGIVSERIGPSDYGKSSGNKPHDVLEDCKIEAECYSRIVNGKGIFEEFEIFQIPDYLKK